jgi:hypothetical protein
LLKLASERFSPVLIRIVLNNLTAQAVATGEVC